MTTIRELLATASLPGESGRLDAELLLCHCLGKTRSFLYSRPEQELESTVRERFVQMLEARREGQPIAYLTGRREFWSLDLAVDEHTLIPRADTETLVAWALELPVPGNARVADWGTGSGAIALALASERPAWQILASDISAGALLTAAANARRLGLDNIGFLCASWGASQAPASLDLLVSNPPYIAADDPHLGEGDLRFEPQSALQSGVDGLDAIRRITSSAPDCLRAGGWLLCEHGHDQGQAVRELLQSAGFQSIASRRDLAGHERVSGGRVSGE